MACRERVSVKADFDIDDSLSEVCVGNGVAALGAPTGQGRDFAPGGCLEPDLEDVQPEAARSTHPRVVLADNEDVVVLWVPAGSRP